MYTLTKMFKSGIGILCFVALGVQSSLVFGQQPPPIVETSLTDTFTPSLSVGFDSLCTVNIAKWEKDKPSASRDSSKVLSKSILEEGRVLYVMMIKAGNTYVNMKIPIDQHGAFEKGASPIVESNLRSKDVEEIRATLKPITEHSLSYLGIEFQADKPIDRATFCQMVKLPQFGQRMGGVRGVGFLSISNRPSFLINYDTFDRCIGGSKEFGMKSTGWQAIDRESGMPVRSSYKNILTVDGERVSEEETHQECEITTNEFFNRR